MGYSSRDCPEPDTTEQLTLPSLISVAVSSEVCLHAWSVTSVGMCDPTGYSPPGSSVHGILQARLRAWVAMPSSRESSLPGD